ncbi:hypothetical protein [Vibrio breoganii]|uniref:hypothetical protein n=1 Tax=Vibrio breoganii TaxID=553239 RepID=UPI000C859BD1|nr:hypothetical protein [Vibrio breoganii]PMF79178.1 hypothetical protein BCV08_02255 [Vibrio breoganii]PMH16624.1 hypothetical protein BCU74_01320 [Vibrio breoganii]PMM16208.1 hypothetical protein BCT60_00515 [Vibrio breoganii]TKG15801.1 hypothetical protein FCV81_16945 [Vibrio breoganii]
MIFDDVVGQIQSMVDLELKSIRPGADITITKVDTESKRICLKTSKGKDRSRPFSELQRIWDTLCENGFAHVDSVLNGSGSSRNQPETIIACLPQIEWLYIDGKKHLVMMPENTHPLGQLRKMDMVAAEELKKKIEQAEKSVVNLKQAKIQTVVVSQDIATHSGILERQSGSSPCLLKQGVYEFLLAGSKALLVSEGEAPENLVVGTYVMLSGNPVITAPYKVVRIMEQRYFLQSLNGLNALYKG